MDDKSYETEFFNLVMGLQSSAWMLLGKVMNPMTGKIEKNLDAAKSTIETLRMLQQKTRGNLTEGEDALLKNTIQQLEINFVEVTQESHAEEKSGQEKTGDSEQKEAAPAGGQDSEEKSEDEEKPKKAAQDKKGHDKKKSSKEENKKE
jgi:hypothetical protein